MRATFRHNLLVAPIVLGVRLPLLLPLWLLARLGVGAERLGTRIARRLPAFQQDIRTWRWLAERK